MTGCDGLERTNFETFQLREDAVVRRFIIGGGLEMSPIPISVEVSWDKNFLSQ